MAKSDFAQRYPYLARWIQEYGWIEVGQLDGPPAFIWALDEGGIVWEGKESYRTIDDAFQDAEKGISTWMKENLDDE